MTSFSEIKKITFLCLLLQIIFLTASAQPSITGKKANLDSLEKELAKAKEDTNKVLILNTLATEYRLKDPKKAIKTSEEALALAEKLNYVVGQMSALNQLGIIAKNQSEYDKALEYYTRGLAIGEKAGIKNLCAKISGNIGAIHLRRGSYPKALDAFLKAVDFFEQLKDKKSLGVCESNLGIVYSRMEKSELAIEHYKKALVYRREVDDQYGIGNDLGNLAIEYGFKAEKTKKKSDIDTSLYYYTVSLKMMEDFGDKIGIAQTLSNMAQMMITQAEISGNKLDFDKAEQTIRRALAINEEVNDRSGVAACYANLASLYKKQKLIDRSIEYYKKALAISLELGETEWIRDHYYGLSEAFELNKDYKNSLENYKSYTAVKDSMLNETSTKQIAEMESKYGSEKKQREIESLQLKSELEGAEQRVIRNSIIVGLVLVLLMAGLIYNRYLVKKKANDKLSEQNVIIEEKNANLLMANHIIEEKNKNITDSINYAKRIQEAILPPKELKYKLFPDAFVLFQPRDIVSGDFYWFAEKDGKKLIAAVDCTGHGVPGAFMSMIGNAFLNEIVNEKAITTPSKILDALREMIITSLKQNDTANKDGMDMSVCCFDPASNSVEFAGANNPLWKFSKTAAIGYEFTEIKGDKQPVGTYEGHPIPFTNHVVPLQKGDSIYIFTDGYADQFGGDKGKKFKYKNLQKLISAVQHQSMKDQENTLQIQLDDWKGNLEQVDDVLIIGVRV